jgi:hypothetical protein
MAEQLQEPAAPRTMTDPVDPTGEVAKRNLVLALSLGGIALLIFAGTILVALIYLQYD